MGSTQTRDTATPRTPLALPPALGSYIRHIPKVEPHNHLEGGAMHPDRALELAAANGMTLPFSNDAEAALKAFDVKSARLRGDLGKHAPGTVNKVETAA